MKRVSIIVACILSTLVSIQAANVSPEKARELAAQFMTEKIQAHAEQGKPIHRQAAIQELSADVLFNAKDTKGNPYIYAVRFPDQEGFVLVSGDDRFAPVLGYSETDAWDEQNMPNHIRAWFQSYVDEMKHLESIGYEPTAIRQDSADKKPIEPMVTTRWNQRAPYYNLCPIDSLTNTRSYTGCVATSMAQVLNYHMQRQHRPTTVIADIPAYTTRSNKIEVPGIPAGTVLPDIANLKDIYDANATAADCTAVAQLMLYCGVALEMDYTSSGSGAYTSFIAPALVKYFGFDPTSRSILRSQYSYADWVDIIYAELAAARPIAYGGQSSGGGHSFVVDGFQTGDFFHVNWGWGGSQDSYYALSVLNPGDNTQPGASTSTDGYSYGQMAEIGCQIIGAQAQQEKCVCLTANIQSVQEQMMKYGAFNFTDTVCKFNYGIGIVAQDGSLTLLGEEKTTGVLVHAHGFSSRNFTVPTDSNFANTIKKIVPISRVDSTTTWCTSSAVDFEYVMATYDAQGVPHLTLYPVVDLVSNGLSVRSIKFASQLQDVAWTVTNNGDEFYRELYLFADTTAEKGEPVTSRGVTILANTTEEILFEWTPTQAGTYNLRVGLDKNGENIIDSTVVTIITDPALKDKILALTGVTFEGIDPQSVVIDTITGIRELDIYADSLMGTLYIKNFTDEVFSDTVYIYYDRWNGTNYVNCSYSRYSNPFQPNAERKYSVKKTPKQVPTNNTYRIRVATMNRSKYTGTIDRDMHYIIHMYSPSSSAIEEVETPPDAVSRKVLRDGQIFILRGEHIYDLMGRKVK